MHQSAVTDRRENGWEGQIRRKNARAKIAIGDRNGLARAESEVIEDSAILAQGHFALGPAVEIVEDNFGETALCQIAEVVDVNDAG
jgi:hypothetical protein